MSLGSIDLFDAFEAILIAQIISFQWEALIAGQLYNLVHNLVVEAISDEAQRLNATASSDSVEVVTSQRPLHIQDGIHWCSTLLPASLCKSALSCFSGETSLRLLIYSVVKCL